jgi:hypothetical protein
MFNAWLAEHAPTRQKIVAPILSWAKACRYKNCANARRAGSSNGVEQPARRALACYFMFIPHFVQNNLSTAQAACPTNILGQARRATEPGQTARRKTASPAPSG